ncbi:hypothetical protein L9F63_016501, partial [Diploptera punctata]
RIPSKPWSPYLEIESQGIHLVVSNSRCTATMEPDLTNYNTQNDFCTEIAIFTNLTLTTQQSTEVMDKSTASVSRLNEPTSPYKAVIDVPWKFSSSLTPDFSWLIWSKCEECGNRWFS